ncbi:MAG: hypothetical protein V4449_02435 [Patescibacteria group bacterium]
MADALKPATEEDFLLLLEKSKQLALAFLSNTQNISPTDFEKIIFEQVCNAAQGTAFEGAVTQTGTNTFPDIIVGNFGIEVKMTISDHWTSTGNSVLESSRVEDVEKIYIVFGKFGGALDIRYRLYQECLPEISVTHSPRYRINMELPSGDSIFDKIGVEYEALRNDSHSIKKIKNYYRSQLKEGEELWWIDQEEEEKAVSPIIKSFAGLSEAERENFIVEVMILFPEIFGNAQKKYERPAAYLIAAYSALCTNLRDIFSAGGQRELEVKGTSVMVPQSAHGLYEAAKAIEKRIQELDAETLLYYWRVDKLQDDRLKQWKELLNAKCTPLSSGITLSDIFDAGLL